jgi:hypothetical protein
MAIGAVVLAAGHAAALETTSRSRRGRDATQLFDELDVPVHEPDATLHVGLGRERTSGA